MRRAVGAASFGLVALTLGVAALHLTTDLDRARFVRPDDACTIADRHGTALRHQRVDGFDRRWVELDAISPHLIDAVVAVEDQRFLEHGGIDPRALARAALTSWWPGRRLSGASTLTQQLVKAVYGRPGGLWDKPREMVRARRLEARFDKRWILEQYLNRLPYGDRIVGVARASEAYFGKPVSELSVSEAALIAGIPQAPSALDPRRHLSASLRRQRFVLARMRETGRIDEADYRRARAESVTIRARSVRPWRAPRFADAAWRAHQEGALEARNGVVRTSLDYPLQTEVRRILRGAVERHAARGVTNGAAIVVANGTGEVLAYVGAAHTGTGANGGWLDLLDAPRQPGSTLKPFVYELLFERGGTAATVLDDLSTPMTGHEGVLFTARDYDGRERGPVRARVALSGSLNLAALDAARRVGAPRIVRRLEALGVGPLASPERYGPAIVLGGADVRAVELASAYLVLARGGTRVPLSFGPVEQVTPAEVMEPGPARVTRDILRDAGARRAAFGDDLRALFPDGPFGLKTGTSSGWRDAWTAAFTDAVTVVVWLGDPAGRPLGGLSGFEGAARPAVRILAAAHGRLGALGIEPAAMPEAPLAQARVCAATGHLAGAGCAHPVDERFVVGTVPTSVCDAHGENGAVRLPARYARWLTQVRPSGYTLGETPSTEGLADLVRIEHPGRGARLLVDPRRPSAIPLRASVAGADAPDARWLIDGRPLETAWQPQPGTHTLIALVGRARSAPLTVVVETPD